MEDKETTSGSSNTNDFFVSCEEKPRDSFFPPSTSMRNEQINSIVFDNDEHDCDFDSFRIQRFLFDKEEGENKFERNENTFTFSSEELLWDTGVEVDNDFNSHKSVHLMDLKDVRLPLSPFHGEKSIEGNFLGVESNETNSSFLSWYHVGDVGGMNVIGNPQDQKEEVVGVHESSSRDTQCEEEVVDMEVLFAPVDHVTELLKLGSERLKAKQYYRR